MNNDYDILIIGSGLSGSVIAERFSNIFNKKVLIIEKRDHIGGNCYDYVDSDTDILMNKYGAHLFHTNSDIVWEYVNKFNKWNRWDHQVFGNVDRKLIPIPVNINSVNKIFEEHITNEKEMDVWLEKSQIQYNKITNSEEVAKSRVGEKLYELLFKPYTFKQWAKYPKDLDPSVLSRIPIRNNFDNRYFTDRYQALPDKGYTNFFSNILNNNNIQVLLNTDFFEYRKKFNLDNKIIIFTGPIDNYFKNSGLDKLEYRSIDFKIEKYYNTNYFQENSVINYPSSDVEYTRIVEYKHFFNQKSNHTLIVKEYTNDRGEPYYPVPTKKNIELYNKYKLLADKEKNVHFVGRLASYKYFNMDEAILNALNYFDENFLKKSIKSI